MPEKPKKSKLTRVDRFALRRQSDDKRVFEEAASLSALTFAIWMRERPRQEARHESDELGRKPRFRWRTGRFLPIW
jgi:hypothetical protein